MPERTRPLKAVEAHPEEPLTVPELQSHGNTLLVEAAKASRRALRASTELEITYEARSYKIHDIERMRRQADEARAKWQEVFALLDELVREFIRAKTAGRGGA